MLRVWRGLLALAACALAVSPSGGQGRENDDPAQREGRFEFRAYREVEEFFDGLGYTLQAWQAGVSEVRRLYLTAPPAGWQDFAAKQTTLQAKKRLFFRTLAPLALRANELILEDRSYVEALLQQETLDPRDHEWLVTFARRYGALAAAPAELDSAALGELMRRVDAVPVSLVLAHAADESGWGTPRFGSLGVGLFDQWSWTKPAALATDTRADLSQYGLRQTEKPLEAVLQFMHHLNMSEAHAELRGKRAELRLRGTAVSGAALVDAFASGARRGPEYAEKLLTVMRLNQLGATDAARLERGPTVFLLPVGRGAASSR